MMTDERLFVMQRETELQGCSIMRISWYLLIIHLPPEFHQRSIHWMTEGMFKPVQSSYAYSEDYCTCFTSCDLRIHCQWFCLFILGFWKLKTCKLSNIIFVTVLKGTVSEYSSIAGFFKHVDGSSGSIEVWNFFTS
jgi:hypothetical protein